MALRPLLLFFFAMMTLVPAENPAPDNTFVSYDYTENVITNSERRSIYIQFYLQSNKLAGYRYTDAVLGSTKKETQEIRFSNEYVPVTSGQRDRLARQLLDAGVFSLKSEEQDDAKRDFSSVDVRIGNQDKQFWFNTPPQTGLKKTIHDIILAFAKEIKVDQPSDTVTATHISQGDNVAPQSVRLEDILAAPARFNGKRISVVGFFHDEFEGRSISINEQASQKRDDEKAVWPGEPSAFAKQEDFTAKSDSLIRIEGVFVAGPGGHMGMWPGEIQRITRMVPAVAPK